MFFQPQPALAVGIPPLHGEGGPPHVRPHRRFIVALHVAKWVVAGVLVSFIVGAIRRRCCCKSSRRAERQARREERRRQRAFRRAAKRQAWKQWFTSFLAKRHCEDEEKTAILTTHNGDVVGDEIHEFRNAAAVVGEIVAAEEGRGRLSMSSLPDYRSELGEDLPSYQDSDGTEAGSYVADGFGYTPGSSEYSASPARSEAGSVRNVLGDTKD